MRVTIVIIVIINLLFSANSFAQKWYSKKLPTKTYTNLKKASRVKDSVQILDLSYKRLKKFPKEILSFPNLVILDLSGNRITKFPKDFGNLRKLQILILDHNDLRHVPKEILLPSLIELRLSRNYVDTIPITILALKDLKRLMLFYHNLSPEEIDLLKANLPNCVIMSYPMM